MQNPNFRQVVEEWVRARYKTIGVANDNHNPDAGHLVSEDYGWIGWIIETTIVASSKIAGPPMEKLEAADPDLFEQLKRILDTYENPDV